MLETLSFKSVLERGFVVVRDENDKPVTSADMTHTGQHVQLEFKDSKRASAVIDGKKADKTVKKEKKHTEQGNLF